MALIVFFDAQTNYRLPDGILVSFYSIYDTNLTQVIDSAYTLNSTVNAPDLIGGTTYITTFYGSDAPTGLYYTTLQPNTDEAIVTLTPPASGLPPYVSVGATGPQGAVGASGYFFPPQIIYDFAVGNYVGENFQLITLSDISPFVPGSYIQLYNQMQNISGVWQVVQTRGNYVSPDGAVYVVQNNQMLIVAIDLSNSQYGPGCELGDIFTANGQTIALYGATSISQNIASLTGVSLSNPQNSDILVYKNGSFVNLPYLVYEINAFANQITSNQIIHRQVISRNLIINGIVASSGINAFAQSTFKINKNGNKVNTVTFNTDGTFTTDLTGSTSITLTTNDVIEIIAPQSQDLTLGNIAINLTGYLV